MLLKFRVVSGYFQPRACSARGATVLARPGP